MSTLHVLLLATHPVAAEATEGTIVAAAARVSIDTTALLCTHFMLIAPHGLVRNHRTARLDRHGVGFRIDVLWQRLATPEARIHQLFALAVAQHEIDAQTIPRLARFLIEFVHVAAFEASGQ